VGYVCNLDGTLYYSDDWMNAFTPLDACLQRYLPELQVTGALANDPSSLNDVEIAFDVLGILPSRQRGVTSPTARLTLEPSKDIPETSATIRDGSGSRRDGQRSESQRMYWEGLRIPPTSISLNRRNPGIGLEL
jgi:hypothetical protein